MNNAEKISINNETHGQRRNTIHKLTTPFYDLIQYNADQRLRQLLFDTDLG